ncbi:MAG: dnaX [Betaproteobacteria bacterium]|nr:dnaX [Betaproteobacteria bacterium]
MSQALARKWRPKTFGELVGQEHVVKALTNALTQQRLHHAYLFTGTRGVGKTTIARIIAKALNCETGITATPCGKCAACTEIDAGRFVDLIELDAASNTQVDNMRDLLENALYAPTSARFKVYIIDEVHMLSRSAFNAMLKTLEEPPGHVKFILATTDPQKIPVTVLSRCLQFNLKQIPQPQIREQLKKIIALENVAGDDEALTLLARAAHGSMRDSLSLLDQAIAHGGGRVEHTSVRAMLGSVEQEYLRDILNALRQQDGAALIAVADRMAERSLSFEMALQDLATLLHRIALAQTVPQAIPADDPDHAPITELAAGFGAEDIQLLYQIAVTGRQDIGLAPDDYAGFTMTLMRMLAFMPAANAAARTAVPVASPTKAAVTAAPARAVTAAPAEVKKKQFDGDWNALINRLPLAGMERMLAHNCELVAWQDGELQLKVPHAQRHLNSRAYQERLKAALEQHLGGKLKLDIQVGPGNGNTLAEIRDRDNEQKLNTAAAAIDGDPFVRDLIENFGARVLPSTIKPVQ